MIIFLAISLSPIYHTFHNHLWSVIMRVFSLALTALRASVHPNLNSHLACLLKFKTDIWALITDACCQLKKTQTTSLLWTRRPQNVSANTQEDKHRHKTILKSILKNRWPDLSRYWSPGGTAGTRRMEEKTDHNEPLLQKRSPTEYEEPFQLIEALLFALPPEHSVQVITRSAGQICLPFSVSNDSWFKLPGGPLTAKALLIGALIRPIMQLIS